MVEGRRTEEFQIILRIHRVQLTVKQEVDCRVEWTRGKRTAKTKGFKLRPDQPTVRLGEKFQFTSQIEYDSNNQPRPKLVSHFSCSNDILQSKLEVTTSGSILGYAECNIANFQTGDPDVQKLPLTSESDPDAFIEVKIHGERKVDDDCVSNNSETSFTVPAEDKQAMMIIM